MRRRRPRVRVQASAGARGYGHDHRKLAAALLAAWQPGDRCARCGEPMWQRYRVTPSGRMVSAIHLGHNDDRSGYRGLEHDTCNLRDGAVRGNRARVMAAGKRSMVRTAIRQSRVW